MQKIKFKKIHPNAKLPTKGSDFAGAYDVYVADIIKESNDYYIADLGFASQIPNGYRIMITPRSSLTKTRFYIPNSPGIVDSDYRASWQVRFRGIPSSGYPYRDLGVELFCDDFPFNIGDRVAQIHLEQVIDIDFQEVEELEESVRGEGGWGSTGK